MSNSVLYEYTVDINIDVDSSTNGLDTESEHKRTLVSLHYWLIIGTLSHMCIIVCT